MHNPLSFLDDLSQQITNVDSIEDETFMCKHEPGIEVDKVDDVLQFLTSSNGDDFADLDFLNDSAMEVSASESYQPTSENLDNNDVPSSIEIKFGNCDPELIKSDCMWSSTQSNFFENTTTFRPHHKGRKRDVSLTLSDCAKGITSITSMEMTGVAPLEMLSTTTTATATEGALWNPVNSETETDNSDEEVDIETPSDNIKQNSHQQHQAHHNRKTVEPGISQYFHHLKRDCT